MKNLVIILVLFSFNVKAQFTTAPTLQNNNPLSQIKQVKFDSTSKILTVFDNKDSWNFLPLKTNKVKEGFAITAKSRTETIYFILGLRGEYIVYIAAYDEKQLNPIWGF